MKSRISNTLILFIVTSYVSANNECPPTSITSESEMLVGWTTNERTTSLFSSEKNESITTSLGKFRIIAAITKNKISETIGSSIKNGQEFYPVFNPEKLVHLISVDSFLDHMNYGHCVYFASIDNNQYPRWSLFTSKPDNRFRAPNNKEIELFYKLNSTCINQGDYEEGKEPPCTKPTLLAITDIDKNNKPEFWATEPYTWDDGLTIWEFNGKDLIRLLEVCVGCSD